MTQTRECAHCGRPAEWLFDATPLCQRCMRTLDTYCYHPLRDFTPIVVCPRCDGTNTTLTNEHLWLAMCSDCLREFRIGEKVACKHIRPAPESLRVQTDD